MPERSKELIQVGDFLSRFGNKQPPSLLNTSKWKGALYSCGFSVWLINLFGFSAMAQSITVKDGNYNIQLRIDGDIVKNNNYYVIGRIDGNIIKDGNYNVICRIDSNTIKDGNYNIIGRIDGNIIKDGNYNIVGRIDGSPRSKQLISILYFLVFWYIVS